MWNWTNKNGLPWLEWVCITHALVSQGGRHEGLCNMVAPSASRMVPNSVCSNGPIAIFLGALAGTGARDALWSGDSVLQFAVQSPHHVVAICHSGDRRRSFVGGHGRALCGVAAFSAFAR